MTITRVPRPTAVRPRTAMPPISSVATLAYTSTQATVAVIGRLDSAIAALVGMVIHGHRGEGRKRISIDLSAATVIDSTALRALVRLSDSVRYPVRQPA